jgi:succinoglycan biosynthesis protein ExoA
MVQDVAAENSADACGTRASGRSVLIVIPSLNEARHIEGVIANVLADGGLRDFRLVVADGGSRDDTCAIVVRLMRRDTRVILLHNPKRLAAAAVNQAVSAYGSDAGILIRLDAHAEYPPQFCSGLLAVQAATGADSVVVRMHTAGRTCFQRATAAAQNSVIGNGGAPHRNRTGGRWVDHGHHALMRMAVFKRIGGYDETFSANEDAELDVRLRANGFRIFLAGGARIIYHPRASVTSLFRQYFNYGRGRARNALKHRTRAKLRQSLPLAVAPALALLMLSAWLPVAAVPALVWIMTCLGFGVVLGLRQGDACAAAAGIAAMVMHAGWSIGFLAHVFAHGARSLAAIRRVRAANGANAPATSTMIRGPQR